MMMEYGKMSANMKVMSIYIPYYKPNKEFMQTSIAKIVDMIKTEALQEAAKIVTCHDDLANCSPEEINEQAKKAEQIYEDTMHTNINEKWNLTEVLTIKLNAIPHIYEDHMWDKIKDEFVHLKPRTPSHLELSLKDWVTSRRTHHEL